MSKKQKKLLIRIIVSAALFLVIFPAEHFLEINKYLVLCMYLVPYFIIGFDVLKKSVKGIGHGQIFDENFLMGIATVAAFVIGEYHEAVFVMLFFQTGELFQNFAVEKSRKSIADLMDICPETAVVLRENGEEEVFPEEVEIGETVLVRAGEKIPLDGVVVSGNSDIDTASLTGESNPVAVKTGDSVLGGCINLSGTLEIRATKEYSESTVAKILELVENSSMHKAKREQFITKFARYYTPAVVVCAVALAVAGSLITGNVSDWIYRALIFLVVSCPCALVISVPLSFFGGIGAASSKGILIKGANYLEALASTETVLFDKTGTLTKGEFSVSEINPANSFSEEELICFASGAEYYSLHPLAAAIRKKAEKTIKPASCEELAGFGVKAKIGNDTVLAGNAALMEKESIEFTPYKQGSTTVYVAVNSVFAGSIILADTAKDTSADAVKQLKELGVKNIVMLTGDSEAAASGIAKVLGITKVHHSLLPEDKVRIAGKMCEEKVRNSTLVFVGDGINDAPVLSCADVGIAMGGMGSDAAVEAADAVIMDDNIEKIASIIRIAKRTVSIVRQNVVFALGVKFAVLVLAAVGLTNMWVGVFADVGVAVIAILNAMRTLKIK